MNKTKTELWIENNILKYRFILFSLGIVISVLGGLLMGMPTRQMVTMGFSYSFILLVIDFTRGND